MLQTLCCSKLPVAFGFPTARHSNILPRLIIEAPVIKAGQILVFFLVPTVRYFSSELHFKQAVPDFFRYNRRLRRVFTEKKLPLLRRVRQDLANNERKLV